jgi:hypothetical protein
MANTKEISTEEKWMKIYFEELKEKGFIKELIYQPEPIILSDIILVKVEKELKTKVKYEDKTLISKHIYTPDFEILWNTDKLHEDLFKDSYTKWPLFFSVCNRSFVEVKGNFDMNNMQRHFNSAIQPWIYQRYNIYVNLVKVPDIFKETFIPTKIWDEFFYKVNGKKFKKGEPKFKFEYRTLEQYLNEEK